MGLLLDDDEILVLIGYLLNDGDLVFSESLCVQREDVVGCRRQCFFCRALRRSFYGPSRVAVVALVMTDFVSISKNAATGRTHEGICPPLVAKISDCWTDTENDQI